MPTQHTFLLVFALFLGLAPTTNGQPITVYVDSTNASGTEDGFSWATAFTGLQDALELACTSGDTSEIWVAMGTYFPDEGANVSNDDRDATFQLCNMVSIYGGFNGTETALSQRDWEAYETILSGDINQTDSLDGNSYTVVIGSGTDSTAVIDGFTITMGNADALAGPLSAPNRTGGGMYNQSGSPTVSNCTFSGNFARSFGGGMYNSNYSSPTVANCIFIENRGVWGGGMYNRDYSSPLVTNCTFFGNFTPSFGGGMYNLHYSSPIVTNCTFSENISNDIGGAMLSAEWSSPSLINCEFSGNSATNDGGALYNLIYSSPNAINCIFSGNTANNHGGGISNSINSSPVISNCTFSGNFAGNNGGAIRSFGFSKPIIANCILWGNSSGIADASNSETKVSFSIVQGGYPGTGYLDRDPLFLEPIDLDSVPTTAGNLRLPECSPAIDAGDNNALSATDSLDLDGNPRFHNATGVDSAIVDMGAYEFQGTVPIGNPNTIYVDAGNSTPGNGRSWDCAFADFQDALDAAQPGDSVWVAAGTFYPSDSSGFAPTNSRNATFQLKNGVAIYGGFMGTETMLAERDWAANETILSGDINLTGNLDGNSYTVVTGSGTDSSALMDGFTITMGSADAAMGAFTDPNLSGGGMYNNGGSPTIKNCTFSENSASGGAGMFNENSSPLVTNCTFFDNSAGGGGGIYNGANSSPLVTNCTFSGNTAFIGGGMFNFLSSSPVVTNCTFSGNTAEAFGGGMYNEESSPTLTNCAFSGNTAPAGGGMFNTNTSSQVVTNCTFSGNTANNGGGMFNEESSPTVTNCILWGNSSGIEDNNSSPTVTYSIVQDGYTGIGNLDINPLFLEPIDLDSVPTTTGDLRLQQCSPAIDAGNNNALSATDTLDLDGNPRFHNATGADSAIVDMGAYEFQGIAACITLSGNIVWEHDLSTAVADATVTLSGDDTGSEGTDANGDYAIPTVGGNSLTLTPSKTGGPYQGVDAADVTRIQQHVTFIDRFDDGYKVIAADVNLSNSVTGLDAAVVFHAINGNPNAQAIFETPSWRFVASTHTFMDENDPWPFPDTIALMNVMADVLNQSFVGVKMGDVNGTWAAPVLLTSPPLSLMVQDQALKAGETLRVPFRATGLPDVAAWQFALRFDTDYLRFERALPTAAFPLKDENFGAWQADRGELRSVFAVPQGLALPKDEAIFELEFLVVYDGLQLSEVLRLDNDILDGRVYNTALSGGAVALTFEAVETRRIASLLPGEAALGFALEQNIPNPFSNETLIRFELPEAGEAVFSVHDALGRLLYEQRGFLDAGLHEVRLDAARLGATGVLSYTLRVTDAMNRVSTGTRRMVLVR